MEPYLYTFYNSLHTLTPVHFFQAPIIFPEVYANVCAEFVARTHERTLAHLADDFMNRAKLLQISIPCV